MLPELLMQPMVLAKLLSCFHAEQYANNSHRLEICAREKLMPKVIQDINGYTHTQKMY